MTCRSTPSFANCGFTKFSSSAWGTGVAPTFTTTFLSVWAAGAAGFLPPSPPHPSISIDAIATDSMPKMNFFMFPTPSLNFNPKNMCRL